MRNTRIGLRASVVIGCATLAAVSGCSSNSNEGGGSDLPPLVAEAQSSADVQHTLAMLGDTGWKVEPWANARIDHLSSEALAAQEKENPGHTLESEIVALPVSRAGEAGKPDATASLIYFREDGTGKVIIRPGDEAASQLIMSPVFASDVAPPEGDPASAEATGHAAASGLNPADLPNGWYYGHYWFGVSWVYATGQYTALCGDTWPWYYYAAHKYGWDTCWGPDRTWRGYVMSEPCNRYSGYTWFACGNPRNSYTGF